MNGRTILSVLLFTLLLMACGDGQQKSSSQPVDTGASAMGAGDKGMGANDNGSPPPTAGNGRVNVDLSSLQKEYARLTGSSLASSSNVIYYASLNEYSNCGEDQLHALLPGQTITPETANPCGAPPSRFMAMSVREDSLNFLQKSQKAEEVGGHMIFHFEKGQQVVVKANSEKQQSILRYHATKIQVPK